MAQTYTSAGTSINSGRLPAVYRRIPVLKNGILFDLGCGKYTDHIRSAMPGIEYLPYDPYNQPKDVNRHSVWRLGRAMRKHEPVTVVCSNVLNVIDDDATLTNIAEFIQRTVQATGGTAYITVYDGDRSGIGRQTGPDQYQRNAPLRDYLKYFRNARIRSGMIVVT